MTIVPVGTDVGNPKP